MAIVSKNTEVLVWHTGDTTLVSKNTNSFAWKIGQTIFSPLLSITWDVKTITKSMPTFSWTVDAKPTKSDYGPNPAIFWGRHTGQPGSTQVIRLRSVTDPTKIIWESAGETNVKGSISIFVDVDDSDNFQSIRVRHLLYSDMNLTLGTYTTIRPFAYLRVGDFPCYVTQEYASTTDYAYLIRYLGYISENPTRFLNGSYAPTNLDDIAEQYGIGLSQANQSGVPLNVSIRLNNGKKITGIIPPKGALCVVKLNSTQRVYGYIKKEGLLTMPTPGLIPDRSHYLNYFVPF